MKKLFLIAAILISAAGFAKAEPPGWFTAPAFDKAPDPARGLSDPAWERATKISVTRIEDGAGYTKQYPTESYWLYAGGSLWVGFKCDNPASPELFAKPNQLRDQTIYAGESVELFLGDFTGKLFYQLIFDAQGNIFDGKLGAPKWDGEWNCKVERHPGYWTAVVEIPAPLLATFWKSGSYVGMDITRHSFKTDGSGRETTALTVAGVHSPGNKVFLDRIHPSELGDDIKAKLAAFQEHFRRVKLPEASTAKITRIEAFASQCLAPGDVTLERYRELYGEYLKTLRAIRGLEGDVILEIACGKGETIR